MIIYAPLADGIYYSYLSVSMDFDNAIDLNALDKLCSAEDLGDISLDEKYVYFVNNSNKLMIEIFIILFIFNLFIFF